MITRVIATSASDPVCSRSVNPTTEVKRLAFIDTLGHALPLDLLARVYTVCIRIAEGSSEGSWLIPGTSSSSRLGRRTQSCFLELDLALVLWLERLPGELPFLGLIK